MLFYWTFYFILIFPSLQKAEPEKKEKKKEVNKEESSPKKEKKALSGGVNIEDTKVGAGAVAKPGKLVMVWKLFT